MTTNYKRGYAQEQWVKEQLERRDYYVMRSGGSKSPIDLIAVRKYSHLHEIPLLIQVKSLHVSNKKMPSAWDVINRLSMRVSLREFEDLPIRSTAATKLVVLVMIYNRQRYLYIYSFRAGQYYREVL